jgi:hypothetical protein
MALALIFPVVKRVMDAERYADNSGGA